MDYCYVESQEQERENTEVLTPCWVRDEHDGLPMDYRWTTDALMQGSYMSRVSSE